MRSLINYNSIPWLNCDDEIFNEFFNSKISIPKNSNSDFPKCDIQETESHLFLSFDLPGVKKEDLNLEIKNHVLTLNGERKRNMKQDGYSERFYGKFQRSFSVSKTLDIDKIETLFEDGVLHIALPKTESKATKKIEIGNGENRSEFLSKLITPSKKEIEAA